MKTKNLGWEENHWILTIFIEDSQRNIAVDQRRGLKIWENRVTVLYDRAKWAENLEFEHEGEVDTDLKDSCVLHSAVRESCQGGEG
jgi:hypothetical protein